MVDEIHQPHSGRVIAGSRLPRRPQNSRILERDRLSSQPQRPHVSDVGAGTWVCPIHRLDGSPKARVFAYKDELDSWLEEKLREREAESTPPKGRKQKGGLPTLPRWNKGLIAALAILAAAAVGTSAWLIVRQARVRWANDIALPEIERLLLTLGKTRECSTWPCAPKRSSRAVRDWPSSTPGRGDRFDRDFPSRGICIRRGLCPQGRASATRWHDSVHEDTTISGPQVLEGLEGRHAGGGGGRLHPRRP